MTLTQKQLKALEAERLDISYRIPADKKKTLSVDRSQALLDIYYHAGRYAAGARDSMAQRAAEQFDRLQSGKF